VPLSRDAIVTWIEKTAAAFAENKEHLIALDAAIGDADHGFNMDRGFQRVLATLPTLRDKDIGSILKGVGMTLISTVGGAAGPLYGTLFLRMAAASEGRMELTVDELAKVLRAGLDGLFDRGKAQPGAKTMIDAWVPAVEAMGRLALSGAGLSAALQSTTEAAKAGMLATIPMQATKGRASYLGERSIGHQDPGATSTFLMLQALEQSCPAT
jgi:dihydroxyacetone kinase-like protein